MRLNKIYAAVGTMLCAATLLLFTAAPAQAATKTVNSSYNAYSMNFKYTAYDFNLAGSCLRSGNGYVTCNGLNTNFDPAHLSSLELDGTLPIPPKVKAAMKKHHTVKVRLTQKLQALTGSGDWWYGEYKQKKHSKSGKLAKGTSKDLGWITLSSKAKYITIHERFDNYSGATLDTYKLQFKYSA